MPDQWKILVISDTHNRLQRAERVIRELESKIDAVYFLGDYLADGEVLRRQFPRLAFLCVAGNCDFTNKHLYHEVQILGHKLYLCHGHRHSVKEGYESIRNFGRVHGYDVILFGHTHEPYAEDAGDLLLLNPGSIGMPYPVYGADYCVLKIVKDRHPAYMFGSSEETTAKVAKFLEK